MGVYIKKLQAKKVETIFAMLGLHIEDGDIIEITEPHGDLIDRDAIPIYRYDFENGDLVHRIDDVPVIIEAEDE